jgi:hypothetical protein
MFDWLDENAPNWLSVLLSALVPVLAFGLPWKLARHGAGGAAKARRRAMLIMAFPVLVGWLALNSALAPAHHVGTAPDVSRDEAVAVKSPRTVGELMLRVGIGGLGAAAVIWMCGAVAFRTHRGDEPGTGQAKSEGGA